MMMKRRSSSKQQNFGVLRRKKMDEVEIALKFLWQNDKKLDKTVI